VTGYKDFESEFVL